MRLEARAHATVFGAALPPEATSSSVVTARTAKASPKEASTSNVTLTSRRRFTCCRTGRTIELLMQPRTAPIKSALSQDKCSAKRQTSATAAMDRTKLKIDRKKPDPKCLRISRSFRSRPPSNSMRISAREPKPCVAPRKMSGLTQCSTGPMRTPVAIRMITSGTRVKRTSRFATKARTRRPPRRAKKKVRSMRLYGLFSVIHLFDNWVLRDGLADHRIGQW